jgi:hypothetical protein
MFIEYYENCSMGMGLVFYQKDFNFGSFLNTAFNAASSAAPQIRWDE